MQPESVDKGTQCQANHEVHQSAIRLMDQAIRLMSESAQLMAEHRPERCSSHNQMPGQLVVLREHL